MQAFIAVMLLTHHMTLAAFIACEALFGMASAFFGPAADGLVPQTIDAGDLQSANALLGISRNTLNVFGPAVSGLLLWVAGPGYVFAIDAASFVVSAAFLARLDVDAPIRAPLRSFGSELREGFRRGDVARLGARADPRLRDLELHVRVVPRARPARVHHATSAARSRTGGSCLRAARSARSSARSRR